MTEARLYSKVLQQMGVPAKQIILENKSKNTFQNAKFVQPLLSNTILLVRYWSLVLCICGVLYAIFTISRLM